MTGRRDRTIRYFDYSLLFLVIFLLGFGLVMLYSVSSYEAQVTFGNATYYLNHQIRNILIGLVFMVLAAMIPYTFWSKKWVCRTGYAIAFLLCVLVLLIGTSSHGSTRWLVFRGISFQPSEFGKIVAIIFLASLLSRMPKQIKSLRTVFKVVVRMLPLIIVIGLTDLSTAIVITGICVMMMFVASPKYSHFVILLAFIAGFVVLFIIIQPYRGDRIQAWLYPESYPDSSYQTMQGMYAIGSGGLFGKGLGGSIQKLGYVPEAENDFIFSIICEELGLFGGIGVILLFGLLIWRFMVISNNSADLFGALLVVGVMSHIAIQVILNLAVVTNSVPNTGVNLPFFSYGGTSMIFLLIEMGLALSVSRGILLDGDAPAAERQE